MRSESAVILAAGRGSRMNALTQDKPKCLVELAGHPLLYWQLEALNKAGIRKITVVRGYLGHCISGNFETIENPNWEHSNMVSSLLCALSSIHDDRTVIVSYSDIVYRYEHVTKLQETDGDIVIAYDLDWQSLWALRQENPIIDAETFREQNGNLIEIGKKPHAITEIEGQYMGLLKFTCRGRDIINEFVASLSQAEVDRLDMTTLLGLLLQEGNTIRTCAVSGGWCECDTQKDLDCYEHVLKKGEWNHDWR